MEAHDRRRLGWRCRRGLLENDLLIERFLARHGDALDAARLAALDELLRASDPELLDLLLARKAPEGELDRAAIHDLLALMRVPAMNEERKPS